MNDCGGLCGATIGNLDDQQCSSVADPGCTLLGVGPGQSSTVQPGNQGFLRFLMRYAIGKTAFPLTVAVMVDRVMVGKAALPFGMPVMVDRVVIGKTAFPLTVAVMVDRVVVGKAALPLGMPIMVGDLTTGMRRRANQSDRITWEPIVKELPGDLFGALGSIVDAK